MLIKPDAFEKASDIIEQTETDTGLQWVHQIKYLKADRAQVEEHYIEKKDEDYFKDLCDFMCSGPILVIVWKWTPHAELKDVFEALNRGDSGAPPSDAIRRLRDKLPGLRKYFGTDFRRNAVHASDSLEALEREKKIWCYVDL
jgi:nucleoside-diphosphate kinase